MHRFRSPELLARNPTSSFLSSLPPGSRLFSKWLLFIGISLIALGQLCIEKYAQLMIVKHRVLSVGVHDSSRRVVVGSISR